MKIILTEIEIKEAITSHVLSQISVAEGHEIKIDFKATRGADGATAEIDISKPVPLSEKGAATVDHFRKPAPAATQTAQETPETEPAPEVEETAEDPSTTSPAPTVTEEVPSTTETVDVSVERASSNSEPVEETTDEDDGEIKRTVPFDADQPVDQEVVPEKPTRSLFAGMQRRNATAQ
jgi:hypothetical protein